MDRDGADEVGDDRQGLEQVDDGQHQGHAAQDREDDHAERSALSLLIRLRGRFGHVDLLLENSPAEHCCRAVASATWRTPTTPGVVRLLAAAAPAARTDRGERPRTPSG